MSTEDRLHRSLYRWYRSVLCSLQRSYPPKDCLQPPPIRILSELSASHLSFEDRADLVIFFPVVSNQHPTPVQYHPVIDICSGATTQTLLAPPLMACLQP